MQRKWSTIFTKTVYKHPSLVGGAGLVEVVSRPVLVKHIKGKSQPPRLLKLDIYLAQYVESVVLIGILVRS